jgi:hypothetical protein
METKRHQVKEVPMVNDTFCDDGSFCVLNSCLDEAEARIEKLETALKRIRDCDFVITLPDRMDAVRAIAREALE